ncbi:MULTISPECIES: flagellar basal body rod C-terminal domain-containing protein [unclassified Agarivorans]|uniref:flagellar basal body rod C-terminal domain-containing protein n=1 Tax=unclassified Agarivorans TaxID=2636026 RepID=UPI0026E1D8AC|nr:MULTISPECIES: flagellar basal body rod C-terminal domain-containing protein [unclassified Agarivorans]MDO6685851.1 flagellar basal body rod C-terminal domain-containing protein [Agarivorans sp. 3_MG-2023]MDO6716034.1 flagellar basal body rod C-terminal domain-containing protein [Agarivorans sp. 2_MG-2023]
MSIGDIKSIAAYGMLQQRMIIEAAGMNIANANKHLKAGDSSQLFRVDVPKVDWMQASSTTSSDINYPKLKITSDNIPLKSSYSPNDPNADSSGMTWRPDIDTTQQLIDVVSANRAYEANLRVYNAAGSMGSKIMELGGK